MLQENTPYARTSIQPHWHENTFTYLLHVHREGRMERHFNIYSTIADISNSILDISNSILDISNSFTDISNSFQDIKN